MSASYKEIKVVSVEYGIIFIENDEGVIFGIVNSHAIVNQDCEVISNNPIRTIEENFNCDLVQDWEHETTTIFTKCKGRIVFSGDEVEFLEIN